MCSSVTFSIEGEDYDEVNDENYALFGGCLIATGITNSVIADIAFTGFAEGNDGPNNGGYQNYVYEGFDLVSEFSWTPYYSNTLTGNQQDGVYGFGSSDNPHSWFAYINVYTSDSESMTLTFSTESSTTGYTNSATGRYRAVNDSNNYGYTNITNGNTIHLDVGGWALFEIWTFPVNEDVSWAISIVTIPVSVPGALALLSLAGIATRRRRK